VTGALAVPDRPVRIRDYPGRMYGRTGPTDAYPDQPSADAPWPVVTGKPPRPRRRVLSLVLIAVVLLLLGGGVAGAWLLIGPGVRGTATPEGAIDGFLEGIYETHDARAAARHVCERARDDDELDQIVFQVKQHEQAYTAARTTWSYPPVQSNGRQATAEVTLIMTTANEQVSSRVVTLLLVNDRGWWVCDVRTDAP
jgi:hypothetical protein